MTIKKRDVAYERVRRRERFDGERGKKRADEKSEIIRLIKSGDESHFMRALIVINDSNKCKCRL